MTIEFEITDVGNIFVGDTEELVDSSIYLKSKEFVGKIFDSEDEMDEYVFQFEKENNCVMDSFSYHEIGEEDSEEEMDTLINRGLFIAEEEGREFDHVMGELLGGVYEGIY